VLKDQLSEAEVARLAQAEEAAGTSAELDRAQRIRLLQAAASAELREALSRTEAERAAAAAAVAALEEQVADTGARLAAAEDSAAAMRAEADEAERARLAEAATAEALRRQLEEGATALSAEEQARLAEVAAAEALRKRLESANAELTAMTLALEEERRRAEETLTLLAAARAGSDDLTEQLSARLLELTAGQEARERAESERDDLRLRLADAEAARVAAQQQLADASGAIGDRDAALQEATQKLAVATSVQEALQGELDGATSELAAARAELETLRQSSGDEAELQRRLAAAIAARVAAEEDADRRLTDAQRNDVLLSEARSRLSEQEALSEKDALAMEALNRQVAELRAQIGSLQQVIGEAEAKDAETQVMTETLGRDLNAALARAALAEQKQRLQAEELARQEQALREQAEAEAARLTEESRDLSRYRSEFFARLGQVMSGREGVRVVGDRFVFSSEVLFEPARATLSDEGKAQIARVKGILDEVADEMPEDLDWIVRVDGHTDDVPYVGEFEDNWGLSQARAASVVRFMIDELGFPPQRLAATGFGEFQPVSADPSPAGRALNRRIELKLTER
jgi:chemotaxis protein MotB